MAPPIAGPAMVAVCVADESSAITRGSTVDGTIAGGIVCSVVASNERAAPSANTAARIRPLVTTAECGGERQDRHRDRPRRPGRSA